ncbi:hypothetical protein ACODT3_37060 [Streptomyces sp. 4.24]|uniref:hypothetical protein n=1 Tax=Streptomyces tritrimontium TaxID=3406573 RepID=UPI003BB4F2EE
MPGQAREVGVDEEPGEDRAAEGGRAGALRAFFAGRGPFDPDPAPEFLLKTRLVAATPALRACARRTRTGGEEALTAVIAEEAGCPAGPAPGPGPRLRPPGARMARGWAGV